MRVPVVAGPGRRRRGFRCVAFRLVATIVFAASQPTLVSATSTTMRLRTTDVRTLDSTLATRSLEGWLEEVVPPRAAARWEVDDCGEQAGLREVDRARVLPRCVSVVIDVVSRDRTVALGFVEDERGRFAFHRGTVRSPSAATATTIDRLSALPAALGAPLPLVPLVCPEGGSRRETREDAGLDETCVTRDGTKVGPGRRWFSAGMYLMERGEYRAGAKTGIWIECDRFERCRRVDHSQPR